MAALSDLARLQIRQPLGRLEDFANVPVDVQAAIANGAPAIGDEGGPTVLGEVEDVANDDDDFEAMSEPTELERAERQWQLNRDSAEFLEAEALGVFSGEGEELYSDQTWRPEVARIRTRPPTPPMPAPSPEHFMFPSSPSPPRSLPALNFGPLSPVLSP